MRAGVQLVSIAIVGSLMAPGALAGSRVPGKPNRDEIAYTVDRKGPNRDSS